ncbi:rod shape-determining protein RodA [Pseudosulfitobacter pseudonitzschiae]|uniref:Peptidoglycan glycosyltransferase MrdB n=1 Tax=Pseudosulfitobacter pseudonitzschiae TaxID=1402135 RepID=A0A073IYQ2_9RHOB|nr:rod shape-determining protein RodA [Pseudosulfitobacter pseudonitzschiae]KEJ95488.1 cell wall shape-determining protein [Pseudosulfitobacter pseudonitzschiae]MBM1816064.1 rod shape-determining protein RodA [Pseudosulfitobacter pseudonitzschiae]MBM1833370.1 rod shape-determining protein RodA [Pseudosulfitobacter pseudonitzschiae]MBM1838237.1 rod shape-determining protein RodA [Pseudosulfitobacter pseudonitzschiae]MBM1842769.1 rod shape-determining protein RodA [Pseudosulfitobacter pseudonitz
MSYLEYTVKSVPTGFRKILYLNWPLTILLASVAGVGFLMLYSVAGGSYTPWAGPQMERFGVGLVLMVLVGLVPIWFWRSVSSVAYGVSVILLIAVELFGSIGMGAQRWIDLGFMRLQPSELMKVTLVMFLAAYYDWLPPAKKSRPFWVLIPVVIILIPTALVLGQPDLGTAILLLAAGGGLMFLAGVHWAYFAAVLAAGIGLIAAVFQSRGTPWQLIKDYQYRRIDTFLDPSSDPLGAGYHITQSKIALGSGGWTGRGFMQGTQSRLNFLPEKHTDFIFTTLAEEFGFVGGFSLLVLYTLIIFFCVVSAVNNRDRFSSLLILGLALNFFLFFSVNMSMVMGLAPVVGVPLPLVSYGGSAMLVLMLAFGFVQSAHIHRPR